MNIYFKSTVPQGSSNAINSCSIKGGEFTDQLIGRYRVRHCASSLRENGQDWVGRELSFEYPLTCNHVTLSRRHTSASATESTGAGFSGIFYDAISTDVNCSFRFVLETVASQSACPDSVPWQSTGISGAEIFVEPEMSPQTQKK
jgi:hypothetical protein